MGSQTGPPQQRRTYPPTKTQTPKLSQPSTLNAQLFCLPKSSPTPIFTIKKSTPAKFASSTPPANTTKSNTATQRTNLPSNACTNPPPSAFSKTQLAPLSCRRSAPSERIPTSHLKTLRTQDSARRP